ncbi:TPA: hypothetical protein ACH3X1_015819 [Trebouxia sp. C0004]
MVCPCRVILAAVSAFVAVFLILHTTRDNSETTDQAADDTKVPLKGGCRVSALHERWSWHTVADLFTGKFLWDILSEYRGQQNPVDEVVSS